MNKNSFVKLVVPAFRKEWKIYEVHYCSVVPAVRKQRKILVILYRYAAPAAWKQRLMLPAGWKMASSHPLAASLWAEGLPTLLRWQEEEE